MLTTEQLKQKLLTKTETKMPSVVKSSDLLSTGSTMLNLACSEFPQGGFPKGKYIFLVGDSSSGKTWLVMSCLAEACRSTRFGDYRFIYDDAEGGALMNLPKYFGEGIVDRLEAPAEDKDGPIYSRTVEEFFYNLDDALMWDQPFIYILDSMDALSSDQDDAKFQERKKAHRASKQVKGSYAMSRPKVISENMRKMIGRLEEKDSLLIVISQTRDDPNAGMFGGPTRSGGRALRFYAHLEIWTSIRKRLTKGEKEKRRYLGILCRADVRKNRVCGMETSVTFPILRGYGIDDISSCVDFMVSSGAWKTTGNGIITAPELKMKGYQSKIVKSIEEANAEKKLRLLVAQRWRKVHEPPKRKKRYK